LNQQTNSSNDENAGHKGQNDSEEKRVSESAQCSPYQKQPNGTDSHRDQHPKKSLIARILRVLWRRRRWRRIGGQQGPNWAEIVIVGLTLGILSVAYLQYSVYKKQAKLMQNAINQTERSIILSVGQLAVANRNSASTENSITVNQEQFRRSQRPYLWADPKGVFKWPNKETLLKLKVRVSALYSTSADGADRPLLENREKWRTPRLFPIKDPTRPTLYSAGHVAHPCRALCDRVGLTN